MNELTIFDVVFERNPESADPYSGALPYQYINPYAVRDRLVEIADEEESTFYDILPEEVAAAINDDPQMSEDMNRSRFFYYKNKADNLLSMFPEEDVAKMELTLYQVDCGMQSGYDTPEIITLAVNNCDIAKLIGFRGLVCKHVFGDNPEYRKKYGDFEESLQVSLNDVSTKVDTTIFERCICDTIADIYRGGVALSGEEIIKTKYACKYLYQDIRQKVDKLNLNNYLTVFVQARELCMGFDRYIAEMTNTANLNRDLRQYYASLESRLKLEYEAKERALKAEYEALLLAKK